MALANLWYWLQVNQRLAVRNCDAGDHSHTKHFVSVLMAAPGAFGATADKGAEEMTLITMHLKYVEHPIVIIAGSLVHFDTGSPQSLITDPRAAWLNPLKITAPPMSGLLGLTFQSAPASRSRLTEGWMIDALVSMNLIIDQGLAYDLLSRQLGWGVSQSALDSMLALRREGGMEVPVIPLEIAGHLRQVILDAGCHVDGYFIDLSKNRPAAGVIQDESSIIVPFESAAQYAEAALLAKTGLKINLGHGRFGEPPPALAFTWASSGVDGIVDTVVLEGRNP